MTEQTNDRIQRPPDPVTQWAATAVFTGAITGVGWAMMLLTSSPLAKGASFLWLPAAFQLMAGIWLGPIRGCIAGGLGAYLAGILAYGGYGPVDIIMNPVAGGLANSALPWILFRVFRVDPRFGAEALNRAILIKAARRIVLLVLAAILLAVVGMLLRLGPWGFAPSLIVVLLAPLFLLSIKLRSSQVLIGIFVAVVISAISALIGAWGQVVGGQTWPAALVGTSLGWFLGDTVSAVIGIYALAAYTAAASKLGISCYPRWW